MIEMLKRHEIQILRRANHTLADVAAFRGVFVRTVRRVTEEVAVEAADTDAERARRGIGRPSLAEPYRKKVEAVLAECPDQRTCRRRTPASDGARRHPLANRGRRRW